jgi:hypothetical protein
MISFFYKVKKIKEDSEIKPDKIKNVYIYSPYKL